MIKKKKSQKEKKIRFDIITLFPNVVEPYFKESILGKAVTKGLVKVKAWDLKDFSADRKHKKVDDRPFGGGPGMVLQFEPIQKAVSFARLRQRQGRRRVILFSTRGGELTEQKARRWLAYDQLILICGRYEGVDERVAKQIADEEVSLGNFVLTGGEIPALAVVDATARLVPGVLGKEESLEGKKGSYPVYTRPETVTIKNKKTGKKKDLKVPGVLLSGNHAKIAAWRRGVDKSGLET